MFHPVIVMIRFIALLPISDPVECVFINKRPYSNKGIARNKDECSLDRARKMFETAHKLGISLKCARFPYGKTGKQCKRSECFWKHAPGFAGVY